MYETNTILELKEPREPDEETNEAFPYNKIRIIGRSPVSHSEKYGYTGADAEGVIIEPLTNFGGNLDEPFGRLRDLYNVVETPVVEVVLNSPVRVIDSSTAAAGPTPEEIFAQKAPGTPPEEGQTRARTNPLGDAGLAPDKSPLSPRRKRAPRTADE